MKWPAFILLILVFIGFVFVAKDIDKINSVIVALYIVFDFNINQLVAQVF